MTPLDGVADDERNLLIANSEEDELNRLSRVEGQIDDDDDVDDDDCHDINGLVNRLDQNHLNFGQTTKSTGETKRYRDEEVAREYHDQELEEEEEEDEYYIRQVNKKRNLYYQHDQYHGSTNYLSKVLSYFNMSTRPTYHSATKQYGDMTFAPTQFDELHSRTSELTNSSMFFNVLKSNQQSDAKNPYAYRLATNNNGDFNGTSGERVKSNHSASKKCCYLCTPNRLFIFFLTMLTSICTFMFLVKLLVLILEQKQVTEQNENILTNEFGISDNSNQLVYNESNYIENYEMHKNRDSSQWLVSTSKCHIPHIDPWHESISEYVKLKPPVDCEEIFSEYKNGSSSLSYVRNNRLYFTNQAVKKSCCYYEVTRSDENDDDLIDGEKCINLEKLIYKNNNPRITNGFRIPLPLIKIKCDLTAQGESDYTNVHSFITHNTEEEVALKRVAEKKLITNDYYNVVMLGVDTISRLNGHRQLSKTLSYLSDEYKTIEFSGYNKVGENTFPNLIPLLTGLKPNQLAETSCWMATNYTDESERGDDYLDNCEFLWNFYQKAGYLTYFSEDWPKASTFNYLKPGFKSEPTNFYGRPFTLARDKLLIPPVEMGCTSCLLDRPIVEVDLENLKSFVLNHQNMPHFAFHWINCPQHDDLNGASQVDLIIRKFFEDLKDITQGNRTFVVFFSDHGYRWNDFVSTQVGHYESSLPLLTIAAPKLFIEQHPDKYENMRRHSSSLLTPFDMFKTMIDIRNIGLKPEATNSKRAAATDAPEVIKQNFTTKASYRDETATSNKNDSLPHIPTAKTTVAQIKLLNGITYKQDFKILSLLDSHTSEELDRSCIEAGIPDNYCVCNQFQDVKTSTLDVLGAAYYQVYVHMGSRIVRSTDLCHMLDLEKIHKAELFDFEKTKAKKQRGKRQTLSDESNIGTETQAQISGQTDQPKSRKHHGKTTTTTKSSKPLTTKTKIMTTTSAPRVETTNVPGSESPEVESSETLRSTKTESPNKRFMQLPNREYNILLSTSPGGGLFQEVVRYYGDNMDDCMSEVAEAKKILDFNHLDFETKKSAVMKMNEKCQFSVRSESMSRLNLYKDQSKCVKSDIELKKICYCNNLLAKT